MSDARKRRKLEAETKKPLASYKIRHGTKLPSLIDLCDEGNIRFFCEKDGMYITTPVILGAGQLFVEIVSKNLVIGSEENKENVQISFDKKTLLSGFVQIKIENTHWFHFCVFDDHAMLSAIDQNEKIIKEARIAAMTADEVEKYDDVGKKVEYDGKMNLIASNMLHMFSTAGDEVELEMDAKKSALCVSTYSLELSVIGYLHVPQDIAQIEFVDIFGKLATSLIKKVLTLFGSTQITIQFHQFFPLNISGVFERGESLNFYIAGKNQDEEVSDTEGTEGGSTD